jgi:transposase-like protein
MQGILTMSQKERDRLKIVEQICNGKMTVAEAVHILILSERQVYRLLKRYRAEGDMGLIHKLRGSPSKRGYPEEIKKRAITLYWQQYRDYGPTLFSETLLKYHGISADHETIRRWLMASGGSNVHRKKRPHRHKRERRSAIGELIQFDGSHHDWFEGRGPACCLLHAIDDASGRAFLRFVPSENGADVLRMLRIYCERYGIPRAVYTDHGSVFYAENKLTDVGRALKTVGVEIIYANSPQAKGRVERGNRTHQDRLIKSLRREGISTMHDANQHLEKVYLDDHNNRFASTNDLPDVHRSTEGYDLTNIFCFQTERQVYNDYTITLGGQYIQLLIGETPLPHPQQYVIVRRWLDGSLHIFWNDYELCFKYLNGKPKSKIRKPQPPSPTHPWRFYTIGKARYARIRR